MRVQSERHEKIQDLLVSRGRVSVDELATSLSVTPMTIRRDLSTLEQSGVLTRTHGGCVLRSPYVQELSLPEKEGQHPSQKFAIAQAAVRLLTPGASVYLDTGTTSLQVARAIPASLHLRVFTNNLLVAMELFTREKVEVVMYGGQLAQRNPDLIGEFALAQLHNFRLDVALIGADAVDVERGEFYAAEPGTAALSRAAQAQADHCLLLVDSSKFGKRGHAVVGRIARGLSIVTDAALDPMHVRRLEADGADVILTPDQGGTHG